MDQDAFRHMLSSSGSSSATGLTRQPQISYPQRGKPTQKEPEASSLSSFKPRKHKNAEERYRDRATERRVGVNDYADVEKVMVDFVKANVEGDTHLVEERRKMLGGDEKHTVLVKGLDFALLEQQRAKLDRTQDIQDDTLLEQAFKEVTAPRKRTREEIVEELKKSRGPSSTIPISDNSLETVKATGKFRPIGAPVETRVKKRKNKVVTDNSEKKSKKRKKEEDTSLVEETVIATADPKKVATDHLMSPARMPSPEIDADADIFADVGEYHGLGSESGSDGDTDEENEGKRDNASSTARSVVADTRKMDWFGNPVEEAKQEKLAERPAERQPAKARGPLPPPEPDLPEELEPEQPSRLQPLASSSVPSIREILAMDEAAEKEEKRKARKEKKKNKKPSETTKIDREVKQLEQYVAAKK